VGRNHLLSSGTLNIDLPCGLQQVLFGAVVTVCFILRYPYCCTVLYLNKLMVAWACWRWLVERVGVVWCKELLYPVH